MSAALQQQVDELREELAAVRRELTAQKLAWSAFHEGRKQATSAAGSFPQPPQPRRSRPHRARPVPGRPSLTALPGGAA